MHLTIYRYTKTHCAIFIEFDYQEPSQALNFISLIFSRTVPDEDEAPEAPGTKRQRVEPTTTTESQETNGFFCFFLFFLLSSIC